MLLLDEYPPIGKIYAVLHQLKVPPTSKGFYYTAYAVWLCVRQPERLLLVTKWLYPDVATHYDTHWHNVERNIRTVISTIWCNNPALLEELAGEPLHEKPRPAQFLAILSGGIFPDSAA